MNSQFLKFYRKSKKGGASKKSVCTEYHGKPISCNSNTKEGVECVYTAGEYTDPISGEIFRGQCKKSISLDHDKGKASARTRTTLEPQFEKDAYQRVKKAISRNKGLFGVATSARQNRDVIMDSDNSSRLEKRLRDLEAREKEVREAEVRITTTESGLERLEASNKELVAKEMARIKGLEENLSQEREELEKEKNSLEESFEIKNRKFQEELESERSRLMVDLSERENKLSNDRERMEEELNSQQETNKETLRLEREQLNLDISSLKEQLVTEYDDKNNILTQKLADVDARLAEINEAKLKSETDIASLLESHERNIEEKENLINTKLSDIESQKNTLSEKLEKIEKESNESSSALERATQKESTYNEKLEQLSSDRKEFESEKITLRKNESRVRDTEDRLNKGLEALAREKEEIDNLKTTLESERSRIESELRAISERETAVRIAEESNNREREILNERLNGIESREEGLTTKLAKISEDRDQITSDRQDLEARAKTLADQNSEIQKRLNEIKDREDTMESRLETMSQESTRQQKELAEEDNRLKQVRESLESLKEQLTEQESSITERLSAATEAEEKSNALITKYNKLIETAETTSRENSETLKTSREELDRLSLEANNKIDEYNKLKSSLTSDMTEEKRILKVKTAEMESEKQKYLSMAAKTQEAQERFSETSRELSDRIQTLERENSMLQKELVNKPDVKQMADNDLNSECWFTQPSGTSITTGKPNCPKVGSKKCGWSATLNRCRPDDVARGLGGIGPINKLRAYIKEVNSRIVELGGTPPVLGTPLSIDSFDLQLINLGDCVDTWQALAEKLTGRKAIKESKQIEKIDQKIDRQISQFSEIQPYESDGECINRSAKLAAKVGKGPRTREECAKVPIEKGCSWDGRQCRLTNRIVTKSEAQQLKIEKKTNRHGLGK